MTVELVPMANKAGEVLEVHPSCVSAHVHAGWLVIERPAAADTAEPAQQQSAPPIAPRRGRPPRQAQE